MIQKEKPPIIRGIYLITSPTNYKYVGKSNNLHNRERQYKRLNCKTQPDIYDSLVEHGFDNHTFEIIHTLKDDEKNHILFMYERYYIRYYREMSEPMLNRTEGGDGVELTPEMREKMRETNRYFRYEIQNNITNDIHFTNNITKFCEDYGINNRGNLHDTLYGYNKNGKKCSRHSIYTILSKTHIRSKKIDNKTQKFIKNERVRRKELYDKNYSNYIKLHENDEYDAFNYFIYTVINIETNEEFITNNLKNFSKERNIRYDSKLMSSLYGYTKSGQVASHYKNYKVTSKKLIKYNKDKETELQQMIVKERELRTLKRNKMCVMDKNERIKYNMKNLSIDQFLYEILDTNLDKIVVITSISKFCKENNLPNHTRLSNTLFGYDLRGFKSISHNQFKMISKHYINPNKDDVKLQKEIESERLRRSLLRNSTK